METVDVVVVGMGPGGEAVATDLAKAGLSVVGIDRRLLGGECPYYACVPTKIMIRAADVLAEARRVPVLAGTAEVSADWGKAAARVRDEATDNWNDQVAVDRFERAGGRFVRGEAVLTGPHEVTVGEQVFQARAIVLNPGTDPVVPQIEGLAGTPFWTNRDAVPADAVPESLIVLGGGPVGCEFGQVFSRFGARVAIVEGQPRLLANDEPEAGALLAEVFERDGIAVHTGVTAAKVGYDGQFSVELSDGTVLRAANLLVATGRRNNLAGFGLPADARFVEVDQTMRVRDGVWAIGDVTGKGAFTHVSMYQARIVVQDILGNNPDGADYRALPRVTFTDPEVGSVGMSEAAARTAGLTVRTGLSRVPDSTRGWIHKAGNEGLIKVVEDADRGVLVGATAMGPAGGEVLGALVVAVHGEVPTRKLAGMIYAYPTFHRGILAAIDDLG